MNGFNIYKTIWGTGAVIFSEKGLIGVIFPYESKTQLEEEIARKFGKQVYRDDLGNALSSTLGRYFAGERVHFNYQVDYNGVTDFERTVYENLRDIPYGESITYKELAERCGTPRAARAVGNAMAKNPYPIVVPCHRVLRSDGSIGGWSGKRGWKERLLALEGIYAIENATKLV